MSDISELEKQFETNKRQVYLGGLAEKLSENKDFRELILEEFCQREVARAMGMAGDPSQLMEKNPTELREQMIRIAEAGGHLKRFLTAQVMMGRTAASQNEQILTTIDEIRAEGGED